MHADANGPSDRLTFVGHSTVLFEVGGARLLTDPVLRDRLLHIRRHAPSPDPEVWRGVDAGLIDGLLVNGTATLARFVGWIGSQLQSGQVGTYAWVLVVGVLAVLGAFTMR